MSIGVTDYANSQLALYAKDRSEGGGCASALHPELDPILASWRPVEITPRVWACFPGAAGQGGDARLSPCFRPAGANCSIAGLPFDICPTTDVWCKTRSCILTKGNDWGTCGP